MTVSSRRETGAGSDDRMSKIVLRLELKNTGASTVKVKG